MRPEIKSIGYRFGLIGGALYFAYYLGFYLFSPEQFVGYAKTIMFLITIVLLVLAPNSLKKNQGSYITFRDAFSVIVLSLLILSLISTASSLLVFQVLDRNLGDVLKETAIENSVKAFEMFNMSEEQIEKSIEAIEKQDLFSFMSHIRNFITWFLIYSVLGLIIAAIIKKNKPEFIEDSDSEQQ